MFVMFSSTGKFNTSHGIGLEIVLKFTPMGDKNAPISKIVKT